MRVLTTVALSRIWGLRKLVFAISLVVLSYGLLRHEPPPNFFAHSDKYLHVLAFFGFSLCAKLAFDKAHAWLLWPLLVGIAVGSEWLQTTLQPSRHFSWADIQANIVGITMAWIICTLAGWLNKNR